MTPDTTHLHASATFRNHTRRAEATADFCGAAGNSRAWIRLMDSSLKFILPAAMMLIATAPFAKISALPVSGPRFNYGERPAQQREHIWMLGQVDTKPVLKKGAAQPVYPPDMLKKKETGSATVAFVVTKKGEVRDAKVIKQTNREFGSAALAAAEQWRYKPAKKKGAAVDCQIAVPIDFTIQKNGAGASNSPTGSDDSGGDSE